MYNYFLYKFVKFFRETIFTKHMLKLRKSRKRSHRVNLSSEFKQNLKKKKKVEPCQTEDLAQVLLVNSGRKKIIFLRCFL